MKICLLQRFIVSFVFVIALPLKSALAVPAIGQKMMVAGPSPFSAEIVREISSKGGNVVDAAVAVAFGLAVTTPYYAGLGGGGFALVKMGDAPVAALDFREVAPQRSTKMMYSEAPKGSSMNGGLAVGVPGVPAGLWALHQKYGKLPWKQLLVPAQKLARDGFNVSGEWAELTSENNDRFTEGGHKHFFKSDKSAYAPGDRLKQFGLSKALAALSAQGPKGFYSGAVAEDIVASVKKAGGILTNEDMKGYKTRWLEPMKRPFTGKEGSLYTLYLMPPPSSGGVVISRALTVIESLQLREKKALSVDELHGLAEALKIAFRGRALLGDPDFHKNPMDRLTDAQTLAAEAKLVKPKATLKLEPMKESEQTTHFSIMDDKGNAVAFTVTLNGDYGSGVVSPVYGIALNNEMDDFTTVPGQPNMFGLVQGTANEVAPGKRPLSSMSPTLVAQGDRIVMSLGSPGGPRIISSVFQVLYRVLVSGFDMDLAIQTPRVHHQFLPDTVYVDANRLSPDVLDLLRARGHKVEERSVAKVYGVRRTATGLLEAAFDSRGEGGAGGH